MARLSVIIPTYNQDPLTLIHVREAQNVTRMPDEIIIVNDGGNDSLLAELEKMEFQTRVVYVKVLEDIPWNYPGACNLGIWVSTGDFLAFEDADNLPTRFWYEEALKYFSENSNVGRVLARVRGIVLLNDILTKPKAEWNVVHRIGPNQGTSMFRREILMQIKGHDERFSGEYGWMYYDFKRRLLNGAKTQFAMIGEYYYTQEGQSNLNRKMSRRNSGHLRRNTRNGVVQPPTGILNFTYQIKILHP